MMGPTGKLDGPGIIAESPFPALDVREEGGVDEVLDAVIVSPARGRPVEEDGVANGELVGLVSEFDVLAEVLRVVNNIVDGVGTGTGTTTTSGLFLVAVLGGGVPELVGAGPVRTGGWLGSAVCPGRVAMTTRPGVSGCVWSAGRSMSRHRICIAGPTVTCAPGASAVRVMPQMPPRKSVVSAVQV